MLHKNKFSDIRFDQMCAYCGEFGGTLDHVPSKVLLEAPFPENLHKVTCCFDCNQSFSTDEEYFACFMAFLSVGSASIEDLKREKIKRILRRKDHLFKKITDNITLNNEGLYFSYDKEAFENVLLKLVHGHVAFECSEPRLEKPNFFGYKLVGEMTDEEKSSFFSFGEIDTYPEVGSRLFNFIILNNKNQLLLPWFNVQDDVYSYLVSYKMGNLSIRILIYNILAVEAIWTC